MLQSADPSSSLVFDFGAGKAIKEAAPPRLFSPPATPIVILGVPFDNVTTKDAIALIDQMVVSKRPHYLATANIDFLVQAMEDIELRRILFEAHLVLCDGTPLLWASRWLGNPLPERVAGSDLAPILMKAAAEKGYRIYLLGGAPGSGEAAVEKLKEQHPNIQIAGHYSPPYSQLLEMNHDEIQERIKAAQPDILLVGFGCPKQEKWISMHYRSLGVPVAVGVGGTIDFLAGKLARAPKWMRRSGLEWLFRVAQEPRRLAGRYLHDFRCFGGPFLRQWWRLQSRRRRSAPAIGDGAVRHEPHWGEITAPEWLDMEAAQRNALKWQQALSRHRHCLLRMDHVRFVDSTGIGLLIRLHKRARAAGGSLSLVSPSQPVTRALQTMRLHEFFDIVDNDEQAHSLMAAMADLRPCLSSPPSSGLLEWQGEVTAANAGEVWDATKRFIEEHPENGRDEIEINLRQVRFLDSTGVSLMIRAKKLAAQRNIRFRLSHPQSSVRNVLKISRLEAYLLEESQ